MTEAVLISKKGLFENLNSKSEFNGPPIKRLGLGDDPIQYQCNTCAAKFKSDKELSKHNNIHHSQIICEVVACGYKAFGTYDKKLHHQLFHEDEN